MGNLASRKQARERLIHGMRVAATERRDDLAAGQRPMRHYFLQLGTIGSGMPAYVSLLGAGFAEGVGVAA